MHINFLKEDVWENGMLVKIPVYQPPERARFCLASGKPKFFILFPFPDFLHLRSVSMIEKSKRICCWKVWLGKDDRGISNWTTNRYLVKSKGNIPAIYRMRKKNLTNREMGSFGGNKCHRYYGLLLGGSCVTLQTPYKGDSYSPVCKKKKNNQSQEK